MGEVKEYGISRRNFLRAARTWGSPARFWEHT